MEPRTTGVRWMCQAAPFQTSASVTGTPVSPAWAPTAMQARVEVQDTASSALSIAPAGLGVVSTRQLWPFQASARVSACPALVSRVPVAVQARADGQVIAKNPLAVALAGLGTGWMRQLAP